MLWSQGGERQAFFDPGGEMVETIDEIGAQWKRTEGVQPLPNATLDVKVPPPSFDHVLMVILERHIRPNNALELRSRVEALENFFRGIENSDAQRLYVRLITPHSGDKLANAFHYYLSAPSRNKLLQILGEKAEAARRGFP
jgi:hypothetical protein